MILIPAPYYPTLYQINTRVWLTQLSQALGRPATLDDIPDSEIWRHQRKDRSILFVRIVRRVIDYCGRPAGLVVVNNVSEQALAEQALAGSEKLLQTVWDSAADSMRITFELRSKPTHSSQSH